MSDEAIIAQIQRLNPGIVELARDLSSYTGQSVGNCLDVAGWARFAIQSAVEKEREACAEAAATCFNNPWGMVNCRQHALGIAAIIRART